MGGPIELNGVVVYAYVVADEAGTRVRVSADDWERLGLAPGARVRVAAHGREAEALKVEDAQCVSDGAGGADGVEVVAGEIGDETFAAEVVERVDGGLIVRCGFPDFDRAFGNDDLGGIERAPVALFYDDVNGTHWAAVYPSGLGTDSGVGNRDSGFE